MANPSHSMLLPLERLPHPVAAPLARARALGGPEQQERAAVVASATLRYATALLLADALRGPLEDGVESRLGALAAPSAESWGSLLHAMATMLVRRANPPAYVRSLAEWLVAADGARSEPLSRLVELASGDAAPLADVEAVLGQAEWLLQRRLVRVLTAGPLPDGRHAGMLQPLEGPSELTEPLTCEWSAPLAIDGLYLATDDLASALDLRPFIEVIYDPASASELCYLFESVPDLVRMAWRNDASGCRIESLIRSGRGDMAWTQWRAEAAAEGRFLGSHGGGPGGAPDRRQAASTRPAPPGPPLARVAESLPARGGPPSSRVETVAPATVPSRENSRIPDGEASVARKATQPMPARAAATPIDAGASKGPRAPRQVRVTDGAPPMTPSAGLLARPQASEPAESEDAAFEGKDSSAGPRQHSVPPAATSAPRAAQASVTNEAALLGASAHALIESILSHGAADDARLGVLWHALSPRRPGGMASLVAATLAPPERPPPVAAPAPPPDVTIPSPRPRVALHDGRSLADSVAAIISPSVPPVAGTAPGRATPAPAQPPPDAASDEVQARPLAMFLGSARRTASGPLATGARIGNRYIIEKSLQGGHLARLFLATDEVLPRRVLLRVPDPRHSSDPAFRERFVAECRQLMSFQHPHVATVLDIDEEGGRPFAVLQGLEGGSLDDRLKSGGLTARRVLRWLGQVADALDAVHARGIIHRDVEPRNVLYDVHDDAYLTDFGMARALGEDWGRMTHQGVLPAAPAYMAPEAVREMRPTPQYDQYSLATIAFRALSGQLPHSAPSPMALLMIRPKTPPLVLASVASVPREASDAIARALEIEPERRFESCMAFIRAVQAAYEKERRLDEDVPAPLRRDSSHPPAVTATVPGAPAGEPRRRARATGDIDDLDGEHSAGAQQPVRRSRRALVTWIVVLILALGGAAALVIRHLARTSGLGFP